MTRRVFIHGDDVVIAVDRWTGDILIEEGRIVALGAALSPEAEVHDAAELLVLQAAWTCTAISTTTRGPSAAPLRSSTSHFSRANRPVSPRPSTTGRREPPRHPSTSAPT